MDDVEGEDAPDSTQRTPTLTNEQLRNNIERYILEATEHCTQKVSKKLKEGAPHETLQTELEFLREFKNLGSDLIGSKKDSIRFELKCHSQESVDDLLYNFKSGRLLRMFNQTFGSPKMKKMFGVKELNFSLEIDEAEYARCRRELCRLSETLHSF